MGVQAKQAQFDRSTQHRRAMIAKIQIGRQQIGMVEDDYRQVLFDTTGQMSLTECTDAQLDTMIARLKSLGFRPLPSRAGNSAGAQRTGKAPAMHPMARKARALWISLWHLNVVRNPAEEALEAFAARQLGCERLVWARQSDAFKLVEALKAMAERNGWRQADASGKPLSVVKLQEGLCEAILAKLKTAGIAAGHWTVETALERLCGEEPRREGIFAIEMFTSWAAALGTALRRAGADELNAAGPKLRLVPPPRGKMPKNAPASPEQRGYQAAYRPGELNRCPGCGHAAWWVGRAMAECAICATALPIVSDGSTRDKDHWPHL